MHQVAGDRRWCCALRRGDLIILTGEAYSALLVARFLRGEYTLGEGTPGENELEALVLVPGA